MSPIERSSRGTRAPVTSLPPLYSSRPAVLPRPRLVHSQPATFHCTTAVCHYYKHTMDGVLPTHCCELRSGFAELSRSNLVHGPVAVRPTQELKIANKTPLLFFPLLLSAPSIQVTKVLLSPLSSFPPLESLNTSLSVWHSRDYQTGRVATAASWNS